jgi:hypothetical protein
MIYSYRNGIPHLAGKPVSLPRPSHGYHFESSRRYPRSPELSSGDIPASARFVGQHWVDGTRCYAWRFEDESGRPRYGFQMAFD